MNLNYLILIVLFIVCLLVLAEFFMVNKLLKKLVVTQVRVKKLEKRIFDMSVGDSDNTESNEEIIAK